MVKSVSQKINSDFFRNEKLHSQQVIPEVGVKLLSWESVLVGVNALGLKSGDRNWLPGIPNGARLPQLLIAFATTARSENRLARSFHGSGVAGVVSCRDQDRPGSW